MTNRTTEAQSRLPAPSEAKGPLAHTAAQRRDEILLEAARQRTPAVLTVRSGDFWQTFKSCFLEADCGRRVLVERPGPGPESHPLELTCGAELGVTFRRGHKKCMFAATVQQATHVTVGGRGSLAAFALNWPESLQEMQRRVYLRALPPAGQDIEVRFWPGGAAYRPADTHSAPEAWRGRLVDLSAGGLAVAVAGTTLHSGAAIGCEFAARTGDEPFILDATLRHLGRDDSGRTLLGLQFIGLEMSPQGQATLVRLARTISRFQRDAPRGDSARGRRARPPL